MLILYADGRVHRNAPAETGNPLSMPDVVILRAATVADAAVLASWERFSHIVSATTDDPDQGLAFGDMDWAEELAVATPDSFYWIAEVDGRPIGAMQTIDPHTEPTRYWGEIEPGLRALDIWIGPADALGRGYGTQMMALALEACFTDPTVRAVVIDPLASNTDAHRFYARQGFRPEGRRCFGSDDCLVHRLTRQDWEARRP